MTPRPDLRCGAAGVPSADIGSCGKYQTSWRYLDPRISQLPKAFLGCPDADRAPTNQICGHSHTRTIARGWASRLCMAACAWARPVDTCGLRVGCAHRGFQLKRGQQLLPPLLESPLRADGASKRQPGSRRVLQPPEGIHLGEGAPCRFGLAGCMRVDRNTIDGDVQPVRLPPQLCMQPKKKQMLTPPSNGIRYICCNQSECHRVHCTARPQATSVCQGHHLYPEATRSLHRNGLGPAPRRHFRSPGPHWSGSSLARRACVCAPKPGPNGTPEVPVMWPAEVPRLWRRIPRD